MKKIIRLARLELAVLFYSPIAWLMLIIFIILAGISFTDQIAKYENVQFLGFKQTFLTNFIFTNQREGGVLPAIQSKLYFFIPLLTMGLMSREISSGSIKLLLSSPIKIREIILGKFVAMMVLGLLFIAVIVLYIITGTFSIKVLDLGHLTCGLLGLYLLICTYSAIGIYMSSLTAYQVVAGILTLTVFAVLNYVGTVWQNYDLIRDITYNLFIANRVDWMIDGMATSRELIYFLLIITLFLGLTILRLKAKRQSAPSSVRWFRYFALMAGIVIVGYISSRPKLIAYWDMTDTKHQTISEGSQKTLQRLKEPLEVTTYVNLFESEFYDFMPAFRNTDLRRLESYRRFHRDMKVNYVYYYDSTSADGWLFAVNRGKTMDEIAAKKIETTRLPAGIFLKPVEYRKKIQLRPEEDNRILRELKWRNRTALVRGTYDDMERYAGEREVMAAVRSLLDGQAKVLFVTGHTEKDIHKAGEREYRTLALNPRARESFINQGVISDTICLRYRDIPDGLTVLIIPDPKLDFDSIELARLQQYIQKGGNLLLLGELRKRKLINQLAAPFGLALRDSSVLQSSKDFPGDFIGANLVTLPSQPDSNLSQGPKIFFKGVGAFAFLDKNTGYRATVTAATDSASTWLRPGLTDVTDSSKVVFSPALGDVKENVPLMVQLTRNVNNREQRILIGGDADLFINNGPNLGFALDMIKWFSHKKYPVEIVRPPLQDTKITVGRHGIEVMKWIFLGGVPAVIALLGTVILIRRKRK